VDSFSGWMSYFWYRCACPMPDGRFNCWLGGTPYNWTKRLHIPWYLRAHPEERFRSPSMTGWRAAPRMAASVVLMPVGLLIWAMSSGRWPLIPPLRDLPRPPAPPPPRATGEEGQ
jgi:hypothetical protein